jgi:hypothetical protein
MPQLKSRHQDVDRIFRRSITAREIAEPLISFEIDQPAERVRQFMEARNYDVVGVRHEGVMNGYVLKHELHAGQVGEHLIRFTKDELIDESDPLVDTLAALRVKKWVFIRFLGNPSGIVTRGDLQKTPVRMWLFGLTSLLEIHLLRRIRANYPGNEWVGYLTPNRLEKTQQTFSDRQRRDDAIDLAECLQLSDKATIFRKCKGLLAILGFESPRAWRSFMSGVEDLRNRVAHSNDIPADMWPHVAGVVDGIERCLVNLETSQA